MLGSINGRVEGPNLQYSEGSSEAKKAVRMWVKKGHYRMSLSRENSKREREKKKRELASIA